jgi:hypothetical protein
MSSLTLTREQISKLISVYDHFKDIRSFSIKLEDDNKVCVSFDLVEIKPIEDKSFIPKIIHR